MTTLKVHITLAEGVTSASAAFAGQKYNKNGFFSFQLDDSSPGILVLRDLFTNNPFSYTDGCGNAIKYAASVGMNRGTGVPGSDYYNASVPQNADFQTIIPKGFDIENHSFFHQGTAENPPSDAVKAQALQDTVLEDDVIDKYVKYKMRGLIVPTNYNGYADAAKQMGYKTVVSEGSGTFDEFPYYNINGSGTSKLPFPPVAPDFLCLTRDYNDDWSSDASLANFRAQIDTLATETGNFYILFSHSYFNDAASLQTVTNFFNYVKTVLGDNFLVCSLREATEYRDMYLCPMTQELDGNVLTLTIDTSLLNPRQRWMDCSFNIIADQPVTGVTVEGFTSSSFNADTGLVNAFLQKTIWAPSIPPGPTPDPVQQINVTHGKFFAE